MNDGYRVRGWAQQNDYTLQRMAEELDYPLEALSQALDHNRIGPRLAAALLKRFGLRVISINPRLDEAGDDRDPPEMPQRQDLTRDASAPPPETAGRADQHAFETHLQAIKQFIDKSRYRYGSD